jgi:hypothetical protein
MRQATEATVQPPVGRSVAPPSAIRGARRTDWPPAGQFRGGIAGPEGFAGPYERLAPKRGPFWLTGGPRGLETDDGVPRGLEARTRPQGAFGST